MHTSAAPREKAPYYLFVEGLLVKVGRGIVPKKNGDDSKLLQVVQEEYIKSNGTFAPYRKQITVSDNFLSGLLEGNQEELVEHIQSHSLSISIKKRNFNLFHFCALGGFLNTFKYLKEIKLPENRFAGTNYLQLAAHGGYIDFVEYLEENYTIKLDSIVRALPSAQHFRQAECQYKLTRMYKKEETKLQEAANTGGYPRTPPDYSSVYPLPSLHAVIPSLITICLHVVAAEITANPHAHVPQLVLLPSTLLELVLLKIAADDQKGYSTLTKLQNTNSGKLIPTVAWVNSIQSAEKTAREFSFQGTNLVDNEFTIPLIDVYANYDTFVLAPPSEFESNSTKLFDQPRKVGEPSIVPYDQFLKQFKAFTAGMLEGLDFQDIVVVGGSVLASLLPNAEGILANTNPDEFYNSLPQFKTSDIDFYKHYNGEGNKKYTFGSDHVKKHMKETIAIDKITTDRSVGDEFVVHPYYPYRNLQFLESPFKSLSELISSVDMDCCAFAFDGKTLWASPRARMAVNHRWNIVNPDIYEIRGTPSYELKLAKYAQRGFSIIDRKLHRYEPIHEEPKINKGDFLGFTIAKKGPVLWGAELIYAMEKWPSVLKSMLQIEDNCRVPFGPNVGEAQVHSHFYRVLNKPKDTHIGLSQVHDPGPVLNIRIYNEEVSRIRTQIKPYLPSLPGWYAGKENDGEKCARQYLFPTNFYQKEHSDNYNQDFSDIQKVLYEKMMNSHTEGKSVAKLMQSLPIYTQSEILEALGDLQRKGKVQSPDGVLFYLHWQ